MPAQVLSFQAALQPQTASAARPVSVSHPLQAALLDLCCDEGELLIHGFVDALDEAVQALMADAGDAAETRAIADLGHMLGMNRPALVRGFMAAFKLRFDPLRPSGKGRLFDLERLCLLPAEELDETFVFTQLAQATAEAAGEAGREVHARLQQAARDLALPALAEALAPQALPECFAAGFRQAGLEPAQRVLACRLVQRHALRNWPPLMHKALALLKRLGLGATPAASTAVVNAPLPAASPATLQRLREARAAPDSGADGALASLLLKAVESPETLQEEATGTLVRLAGAWMDALIAAPELPGGFVADLDGLRLVLAKAALTDPTFFVQPLHPVRRAVDELVQNAAFTGLQGFSLAPLREDLKALAARISVHGQFVIDAIPYLPLPDARLLPTFHRLLSLDQDSRRERLMERVRTLVTREIEARTLDVMLPAAARAALTRGFHPLLSSLYLRQGVADGRIREARQLLERFVDSFTLAITREERQTVLNTLCTMLLDHGIPDLHIAGVAAELEKAYAALQAEAEASRQREQAERAIETLKPAAPLDELPALEAWNGGAEPPALQPPAPQGFTPALASNDLPPSAGEALSVLLKAGLWFRVRDYKRGDDRWLALAGVHMDQDRLAFTGFDGSTALMLRASQFVHDLCTGLAEPLSAEPAVQAAVQALRAQPQAADFELRRVG